MAKLTTEEFIKKAQKVHGDMYDYSKVEYVNSKTKVCIICKQHGEFWQQAVSLIWQTQLLVELANFSGKLPLPASASSPQK